MGNPLHSIVFMAMGTSVVFGGVLIKTNDILARAESTVDSANVHQLSAAVEMYYLDHNSYPDVKGGKALVDTLKEGRYIRSQPLDPAVFNYEAINNGQDYNLDLKK